MGDFDPTFAFDFEDRSKPAQTPWDFAGTHLPPPPPPPCTTFRMGHCSQNSHVEAPRSLTHADTHTCKL